MDDVNTRHERMANERRTTQMLYNRARRRSVVFWRLASLRWLERVMSGQLLADVLRSQADDVAARRQEILLDGASDRVITEQTAVPAHMASEYERLGERLTSLRRAQERAERNWDRSPDNRQTHGQQGAAPMTR